MKKLFVDKIKALRKSKTLPGFFRPMFWSYKSLDMDPEQHKNEIIVQTINYGGWMHWKWIVNYYGKKEMKKTIQNLPVRAFLPPNLKLISLLLNIKKFNYAPRGTKPRYKSDIPKTWLF